MAKRRARFLLAFFLFMASSARGEDPVAPLVQHLRENRTATPDELRAVLKEIRAEVPNAKGIFELPKGDKTPGEVDWVEALGKLPASPARDEAIDVVKTLRA